MKKTLNNLRFIFTALQVSSVIAILVGGRMIAVAWPTHHLSLQVMLLVELALWCAMWLGFLRMCGRLKREPSAFTERNARTLLLIAVCCGLTGLLLTGEMIVDAALSGSLAYGWIMSQYLFTPILFFGVMTIALVLHRLLRSAISLQQDSDLTI